MKLYREGWGYTKIHKHLLKNGFKIGKSRTCVYNIIKKELISQKAKLKESFLKSTNIKIYQNNLSTEAI